MRTEELLEAIASALTEESCRASREELTETNKRLGSQTQDVEGIRGDLWKEQQGELQQANEELAERAQLLTQQKSTEVET